MTWTQDGTALLLLGSDRGTQDLFRVEVTTGAVTRLTQGAHVIYSWSFDHSRRRMAVALTEPHIPGELFWSDLSGDGHLERLTDTNASLLSRVELAPVEVYSEAPHAWIMKPLGFEEGKRYPAVLQVHGGPMAQYGWTFFLEFQLLAAQGYAVVYSNPRGSQGYGEEYCACIEANWGTADYEDVMAALDQALERFPWIDADKLGMAGGSYGGYMVNHTLGQTNRFKAGITMRSCVNEGLHGRHVGRRPSRYALSLPVQAVGRRPLLLPAHVSLHQRRQDHHAAIDRAPGERPPLPDGAG